MRKILFMALAVLIAAGCAESEKGTLCVKIAPAIRTRVTGLHFDTGDRIGLTISKGSALYAENVPMTYDGTAFTASGLSWYNDLNEKSVLTAYYPYAEGGRPDEFTVSSDQTQGNGPSDLLAAVKTDVTPVSAPVGMIFYHVMSQLTIVLTNNSDAPDRLFGAEGGGQKRCRRCGGQSLRGEVRRDLSRDSGAPAGRPDRHGHYGRRQEPH